MFDISLKPSTNITEILQLVDDLLGGVFDGYHVSDLFRDEVKSVAENYPWN